MDPRHSIPPITLARRRNATKMWHIVLPAPVDAEVRPMACGQRIRKPVNKTAFNADEITCHDCIVADVRRLLDRISVPLTLPKEPTYDSEGNLL